MEVVLNKRKIVRSTNAQLRVLVDYMAANPLFAVGEYCGPLGAHKLEQEWTALAAILSNHGPLKTVEQWKHSWRDLKKKAREEGANVRRAQNATGNSTIVPNLSEQSQKILDTIGHACATGIASADYESGLGTLIFPEIRMEDDDIDVGEEIIVQQSRGPSTSTSTSTRQLRRRAQSKSSKFIASQEKTNEILQGLRQEVAKANEFWATQLKVLQEIADNLKRS